MKATHSTESTGLGSLQGIRWLLAVGAPVLAVSVYRLVEAQWAGMPVTTQFLTLVAGPFAFLDASGRVPAIVSCAIAALLFRWSFRYENVPAHVFAMCASVVGYVFLPTLMPQVAVETVVSLTDMLGLVAPAAKLSFGQLGLALFFTALSRRAERAGQVHAICASIHLIAIVALSGFAGVKIVAPLALALALLSVFITRRREWLPAAHAALGAGILAWGGAHGMELLALVMIGVVALSRGSRHLTWPAFFWAGVIGISGDVHRSDIYKLPIGGKRFFYDFTPGALARQQRTPPKPMPATMIHSYGKGSDNNMFGEIEFRPASDKDVAIIFRPFSAKNGLIYEHKLSPGDLDIQKVE